MELPADPLLRQAAIAMRDSEHYGLVLDRHWRVVYATDAQLRGWDLYDSRPSLAGHHFLELAPEARGLANFPFWIQVGEMALADTPGGREELRSFAHPDLKHLVDDMEPNHDDFMASELNIPSIDGTTATLQGICFRIRNQAGEVVGVVSIGKPGGNAFTLGLLSFLLSPRAVDDMNAVMRPARRPGAILCADLEGSSALSRTLSAASYFKLTRRLVFAADRCVVSAGGLVGRHAGDGVTAFFLSEQLGSESAASRACIDAARSIQEALPVITERAELATSDLVVRFGLHWGSTLYVGAIMTEGRFEVTAMGDEVNEAARIEACATGGLALASKALIERLTEEDAAVLGMAPERMKYSQLSALATATEKARRDAPSLSVCSI
jgi:class 3 adenylate cyclase